MKSTRDTTRRSLLAGLSLIATAFFAVVPSAPAAAYLEDTIGSSPGNAVGFKARGLHYDACGGYPSTCYNPEVYVPAPYAFRSPASSGHQDLALLTILYRWNGSTWVQADQQLAWATLAAGEPGIYLPTADFKIYGTGEFRIASFIEWRDSSTQHSYGSRLLSYELAGDYECVGAFTAFCDATDSYIYLEPLR